jgi:hypothetical protein
MHTGNMMLVPLESLHQPFIALVSFWIGSCVCSGPALDCDPPSFLHLCRSIAGTTEAHAATPSLVVVMGVSLTFLPKLASGHDPPDPHLPSSWDYSYESPCSPTLLLEKGSEAQA